MKSSGQSPARRACQCFSSHSRHLAQVGALVVAGAAFSACGLAKSVGDTLWYGPNRYQLRDEYRDIAPEICFTEPETDEQKEAWWAACNSEVLKEEKERLYLEGLMAVGQAMQRAVAQALPPDSVLRQQLADDLYKIDRAEVLYYQRNGIFTANMYRLVPFLVELQLELEVESATVGFKLDADLQHVVLSSIVLGGPWECSLHVDPPGARRYYVECSYLR